MEFEDVFRLEAALLQGTTLHEETMLVVVSAATRLGLPIPVFLDELALTVARRFERGTMRLDDAMGLMAVIYNGIFAEYSSDQPISGYRLYRDDGESLFAQVYWALDEGEYGCETDGDLDPIEARVLPELRRILAAEEPQRRDA